ncbi:CDP-glucose 4,6-dehydratase [Aurantimicrobium minutum]|uniref:CDP-glucose 4,6-dehydratase n=1 Tax=Aurantimicrobium minutum TaxID=708131 RepID=UPI00247456AB|nr:CDP-glucose 4,6-dehydratase [Aurantimicrobium minutum]MDH6537262.1 CDP-glucose 4,6-dehydratase [Aurantimicrobium minutum]
MHYLVTGHTGFKGAWLTLLLKQKGHTVSGISLDPEPGSLFETAHISDFMEHDFRVDIRDSSKLSSAITEINPDVLIHLAAQPLVRRSYREPRETFETNVNGTLNVLEASQNLQNLKARLIITTDKVYKNVDRVEGYVETEPLGGDDPYSSSKAMADLLTQSWVKSFPAMPTAIARAGNVIGGGDVCEDRLIPDAVRAFSSGKPLHIRYPNAVRPWQHVLDCVNGYLALVEALLAGKGQGEWNFGPGTESFVSVGEVSARAAKLWSDSASVLVDSNEHPHEANLLSLDSTKSQSLLLWDNKLKYPLSLEWTISWYRKALMSETSRTITEEQLLHFLQL